MNDSNVATSTIRHVNDTLKIAAVLPVTLTQQKTKIRTSLWHYYKRL
jgi:hypothetical protein